MTKQEQKDHIEAKYTNNPKVEDLESDFESFLNWRNQNPNSPLFLPPGSVRSIIVIVLLVGTFALLFMGINIPEWLTSMTTMAVAFYFGGKLMQEQSPKK